jgi:hypothetical protein
LFIAGPSHAALARATKTAVWGQITAKRHTSRGACEVAPMHALIAILLAAISRGVPLDPQPPIDDGFGALCLGPWMHADAVAPYRGVASEDNGSGRCCALATSADAFVCVIHPGHQHGPVVEEHLRFYDGKTKGPRLGLVIDAVPNPGMRPNPNPPPPYATLALTTTADGFTLTPRSTSSCVKPSEPAKEVCTNAGHWLLGNGIPKRR